MSAILKVGYSVEKCNPGNVERNLPHLQEKTRIIKEYETMVHQLDLNMTAEEVMKQFADRVKRGRCGKFCNGIWRCKTSGRRRQYCHYSACGRRNRRKMEVEREIQVMLTSKSWNLRSCV